MSVLGYKLIPTRTENEMEIEITLIGKVNGFYIGECSKCDDEVELLITEDDLICQDCGSHEPHYTD